MPRMYQQFKTMDQAAKEKHEELEKSKSVSRFLFWSLILSLSVNAMFFYSIWVA